MAKKKRLRLKKKVIIYFLFLLPIPILTYSTIQIIGWLQDSPKTQTIIKEIEEITEVIEYESEEAEIIESDEHPDTPYWNFIKMNLIDVDFTNLKETNKDTVAWLSVGGTNINYPVVQTTDNDFYLDHSFDKSYNKAGWLFMDYRNNPNEYEKNTIIYAHNRKDKTMFGTLKNVLAAVWYKDIDNRVIKMSSENSNTLWQIFSVYTIETTNDYIKTIFKSDESYQKFIDLVKGRSLANFNTTVTTNDKILTLSTCHGSTKKLVVHAKLIKQEIKN